MDAVIKPSVRFRPERRARRLLLRAGCPRRIAPRADPCVWPSQNIACLRTSGLRLLRATSISFGTPSSFGSWLSANTAFFLTSVSGSLSIAPAIVASASLAGLLREPEQRLAADLGALVVARRRDQRRQRERRLADRQSERRPCRGPCRSDPAPSSAPAGAHPARPRVEPSQNAVSPRSHSGRPGATKLSSARSARRPLCSAIAVSAVLPTRSCRSPLVGDDGDERREPRDAVVRLHVGQPDERHAGRVDVAVGRERPDARDGAALQAREDQELGRAARARCARRRRSRTSPVFIDTPPPLSRRHMPAPSGPLSSEIVS